MSSSSQHEQRLHFSFVVLWSRSSVSFVLLSTSNGCISRSFVRSQHEQRVHLLNSGCIFLSLLLHEELLDDWTDVYLQVPRGRLTIRCARVGGVEIPNNKRIEASLQYVHGVGQTTARQILLDVGLENKRTKELTDAELTKIRDELGKYMIEGDLRRFVQMNIKHLIDIQCYRGKRHQTGLPVRGQRTRTNARTRKGKKRIAIAGKKKAR